MYQQQEAEERARPECEYKRVYLAEAQIELSRARQEAARRRAQERLYRAEERFQQAQDRVSQARYWTAPLRDDNLVAACASNRTHLTKVFYRLFVSRFFLFVLLVFPFDTAPPSARKE